MKFENDNGQGRGFGAILANRQREFKTDVEFVPCARRCGRSAIVTATTLEFAAAMNHIRARQGIPLARKGEIALCTDCYVLHKAEREEENRKTRLADEQHWLLWLAGDATDEQFLARVSDSNRGEYRGLMDRVKGKRSSESPRSQGRAKRKALESNE